ncbi:SDR family NAD(P)-dependent oxidoreductase [Fundicoccus culcitae]|uniref:SDR family NAD(P)-dependent oxidoreductase n=1 Tax=Fundicoccus culcitae TaxID=2969821 RepID=A0ABY5P4X2_9LACT|nr:SDR family NAD(P)-dependent oxidoreductase [Fundicoccus culcitae]UUX33655.1 SDR family NAD(P)-dependent oxidoreductase [Fundicoccus culcitae]
MAENIPKAVQQALLEIEQMDIKEEVADPYKIFITGSTTGVGLLAAKYLLKQGHHVVVHARNVGRAEDVRAVLGGELPVVIGDLAQTAEVKEMARALNQMGTFDVVIHNAGIGSSKDILLVNVLAPYILTCLMHKPQQLIYTSSDMHSGGSLRFNSILDGKGVSYSDSKLLLQTLASLLARRWQGKVLVNTVDPGWVPTRMSGGSAPDDLHQAYGSYIYLIEQMQQGAQPTGSYYYHSKLVKATPASADKLNQARLAEVLEEVTGVTLN